MKIEDVKVINKSDNVLPEYKTSGSSGMDIRAFIPKPIVIPPHERRVFGTGLYFGLPKGLELQIRSRSGLAFYYGIIVLNEPATIDSDYRGELKVVLYNSSNEPFTVESGFRIAQGVFAEYTKVTLVEVGALDVTVRADKGIGHTGIN